MRLYVDKWARYSLVPKVRQQLQAWQQEEGRKSDAVKYTGHRDEGEDDVGEEGRVLLQTRQFKYLHTRRRTERTLFSTMRRISTKPQATNKVSRELEKVCV